MKISLSNPVHKSVFLTLFYYAIAFGMMLYTKEPDYVMQCGISFHSFLKIFLPFISIILFLINFLSGFIGYKNNKISAIMHFIAIIYFLIMFIMTNHH